MTVEKGGQVCPCRPMNAPSKHRSCPSPPPSLQAKRVADRLADKKMRLQLEESGVEYLARQGYDPVYGARWVRGLVLVFGRVGVRPEEDSCHATREAGLHTTHSRPLLAGSWTMLCPALPCLPCAGPAAWPPRSHSPQAD